MLTAISSPPAVRRPHADPRLSADLPTVASGLGAVAAGFHITPPPLPVPRPVVENARAPRVAALSNPVQLAGHEPVGRGFDDRDHETGEDVTGRHEAPDESAVRARLHAPRARAAPEDAVDLGDGRLRGALAQGLVALGARTQHAAQPARLVQRGARAGRLLLCAAH